jgi:hypothetical protein
MFSTSFKERVFAGEEQAITKKMCYGCAIHSMGKFNQSKTAVPTRSSRFVCVQM